MVRRKHEWLPRPMSHREQRRLRLAQLFIVRLFTKHAVPRLLENVHDAEVALASAEQQLAGCSVEIDFAFDQATHNAFAEVRELQVKFSQMSFIEEEGVPSDSEVIGETWKKTNKDGSRDRRFASNYQISRTRGEKMGKKNGRI
jgi:hypothetical protein